MSSWRDAILNDFEPNVSKLILVVDPDCLLTEEKLALELRGRGFDLIEFNEPVEFRYAYESKYRSIWDRGDKFAGSEFGQPQAARRGQARDGLQQHTDLVVILRLQDAGLESLPYDLLQAGRKLSFNLGDLFPNLSYPVIEKLDRSLLDALFDIQRKSPPDRMGDNATKDFILRHVFGIAAELIANEVELLRALLRLHYGKIQIPHTLAERLVQVLRGHGDFQTWPLDEIVPDDEVRINRLFELVEKDLPTAESRYSDWTAFALKWAELSSLVHCGGNVAHLSRFREVGDAMNATFAGWLSEHYASLINLPPTNPAMLHHVPRRLARDVEGSSDGRAALIVVDGLALDQWVTVRQLLQKQDANLVMRESATFAWIPTLTSVSRQAIFSGKPPLYFPSSINSTHSEEKLWKQFWEGHGLSRLDIAYQRGLGDGNASSVLDAAIHPGKTRVVGLVVDKVDKIMHGMQLGSAGMHNQIRQWCQGGFLGALIGYLLNHGYQVWLTADHGNIECRGKGRPSEGVIAETRGERVRVYPTPELRSQVATTLNFAHEWQPVGLPSGYFPLVAGGRDAFLKPGVCIVGHGGIAVEEVIVPLVKFERRARCG